MNMKRILQLLLLLLLTAISTHAMKVTDVANVHLSDRTRYVSDNAGVLSATSVARIDSLLASAWRSSSAEPVVVIVPDLSGDDIDTYATELFELWGIGKKDRDNGVLMLISINDRKACIRTGYGAEEFMPDVLASNIIRNVMAPNFRKGDYDTGVVEATRVLSTALSSPEAREALMSDHANDSAATSGNDDDDFFAVYLALAVVAAAGLTILVLATYINTRREPTAQAYGKLQRFSLPCLVIGLFGLGIPLVAYLVLVLLMRHIRLHKRLCPNCGTRMGRVDEDNDNNYLTQSQDAEEHLDSVDYDVWLCPSCGETDIIPYVNPHKNYTVCPVCQARACTLVNSRTLRRPTQRTEGQGVEEYECLNCRHRTQRLFTIPKVAAPPVVIIPPGGGRGGFGGGGGFSGGSFGGGMTGGGGASGGW